MTKNQPSLESEEKKVETKSKTSNDVHVQNKQEIRPLLVPISKIDQQAYGNKLNQSLIDHDVTKFTDDSKLVLKSNKPQGYLTKTA